MIPMKEIPVHYPFARVNRIVGPHCLFHPEGYGAKFSKNRLIGYLMTAVRTGKIKRPQRCAYCLKITKPDGHHITYDDPFADVVWYCRKCHKKWHLDRL